MSQPAIRVENLSKQFRIGARQEGYRTLRETLADAAAAPFRRLRNGKTAAPNGDDTIWALKDVSFEVQPGEVVGIIGRNGAGKSTLLKVLSRITEPTHGRVEIRGRVASLLEVGTGFHPELTGRENILLNGAVLGMSRREILAKFDEIIAFAEVERFIDTPVKRYSSGMYLRLAFAVAAHLDPEILMVDEVLAVGDAAFQKKCLGKMGEVARGGRTVLFVSHNMSAVQQLCQTAVLMRGGRLHQHGPSRPVIADYLGDASTSANGAFDLSHHPVRVRGRHPVIHALELSDAGGMPTTVFHPGSTMQAEIILYPRSAIANPRVALSIEDECGRRITTLASYFQNPVLPNVMMRSRIRCHIPHLPLAPGRYLLSVSVGTRHDGLLDSLDGAGWFDVSSDRGYATGEPHDPVYGPVVCPSMWSMAEDSVAQRSEPSSPLPRD